MDYKEILRKNKLKITPKRLEIIDFFLKNEKYVTPVEVWEYLKKRFKKIGLPTTYRNLEQFEKIGILAKIIGEENRFYFGLCKKTPKIHHHHIVCTLCHKISDFNTCNFYKIKTEIEKETKFKIKEHYFFIKGICQNCQKGREEK